MSAEPSWDHERELAATLDKLGFAPKPDTETVLWRRDMMAALADKGIKVDVLVEEYRERTRLKLSLVA